MVDVFEEVIEKFRKTKGLTKKNSEKFIVDLLENESKQKEIIEVIKTLNEEFGVCQICFYYTYKGECPVCDNPKRNKDIICVVATMLDAKNIESKQKFNGVYAILGGEVNLSKNIAPANLKINEIFSRVNEKTELILALNATFEGEVTSNYIAKIATKKKINVSKIAVGIPLGGMLDYMDENTLFNAINNRKKYEE